jgi:hypothetical protein
VKYAAFFVAAEQQAHARALGLWSRAASTGPRATPRSASGGSSCSPSYQPCLPVVSDLDCADVIALGLAPVRVIGPDVYHLDGNHDGVACE